ncbi:GNAT family N-acetyltransferase [Amylibacter sp.]|nr:GNAT family N-acetyltransferase [Amylibacter sp.]
MNKIKYKEFCKLEEDMPIFSCDWWLDTVCGENNWDVALFEKGGHIYASMPYYKLKKFNFYLSIMPILTQTLGIYIKYPRDQKYHKKMSWEKKSMLAIIDNLPKVDYFSQNFHSNVKNWLPFYWAGYEQTTRYSYIIDPGVVGSMDSVVDSFESDIRRRINKVISIGVEVFEGEDIKLFYELNKMTFFRKGMNMPYSFEFIENLYRKCKEKNSVKMFFAKDKNGVSLAACFLVYDKNVVYYLMGGIDPSKKGLGAMDLVLFESIKFAMQSNKVFDFEGSMIESIEKYFRSFGAVQKSHYNISKINSRSLKIFIPLLKKSVFGSRFTSLVKKMFR